MLKLLRLDIKPCFYVVFQDCYSCHTFFVILPFLMLLEKSNNCDFTRRPITKYYNVDYRQLDVVQLSKVCVN